MDRKTFLYTLGVLSTGTSAGLANPLWAENHTDDTSHTLTILHTNDTHSHIKPFPETAGEQLAGLGGYARRATLIKQIRQQQKHVLLLDAGDIFQGTPYFNYYKGELELELMSAMRYDASALGNHEFDNGVKGLAEVLPNAQFPFLCANYFTKHTPVDPFVEPFIIKNYGSVKVGIFGLGISFENLVPDTLHKGVTYRKADLIAEAMVRTLKQYHRCDYIICLSHLGFKYNDDRISDMKIAQNVDGIDLIVGGHTHTFMDQPVTVTKPQGRNTMITQVGWGGVILGRIDVQFSAQNEPEQLAYLNTKISSNGLNKT